MNCTVLLTDWNMYTVNFLNSIFCGMCIISLHDLPCSVGATLKEENTVSDASFDESTGLWTVTVEESEVKYKGRVLLAADGSTSKLAIKLGLVKDPPKGVCSRAYIKGGTHKFKADGVMFYRSDLLPGYGVLFRHPNDELNYCCYIIPGNPQLTNDDLSYWHHYLLRDDPNISRAVGTNADIERMRVAPYRYGGEKCTYGNHILVIGDAAGFVDPMTGEGIHTAMDSGRIAAKFLCEAFDVGNFDKEVMKEYQNRWLKAWGHDFKWSYLFVQLLYRHPILLDAATAAIIRKGEKFLARWGEIMTGRIAKVNLLRPEFVIVIGFELMVLLYKKYFRGGYTPLTKKAL
jgi:flavin-dependent dehydrogenase